MIKPEIPLNEPERLRALKRYNILDTLPEADYDNITQLACMICNTPVSAITLVDDKRMFHKSMQGLALGDAARELAFCAHAINTPNDLMIVPDSSTDERFADNPYVVGLPNVVFYTGTPLVTSDGFALGTLCVIDHKPNQISDQQKKALKYLGNQVVRLLELRLKNEMLSKSQEELSTFAREMEAFAHVASHDLKEPLRMVKSFVMLLESKYAGQLDERGKKYISMAVDGAKRMDQLIDDLLEYSQAGNITDEDNITDVNKIIEEVRQLNKLNILENKVIIQCAQMPIVHVPQSALRQVFQNLIGNAIKYQSGTIDPVIVITCKELRSHWKFSVKDNGIGIDPKNQEAIFNVFKRLHRKDQYPGTGLGLAICKKIVEKFDGKIWVESAKGAGSTFHFTIRK